MTHDAVLQRIIDDRIIAIVRGVPKEKILDTARAISDGGIRCLEITFDHESPNGERETLESIELLATHPELGIMVGAGTVIEPAEVVRAKDAGAHYIVSPDTIPQVIELTRSWGLVSIPGAYTATEVLSAHKEGADIVKLFPAGLMGPSYFKALMGPLGFIKFSAVGNISKSNIRDFRDIGVTCFGIGGSLVDKKAIAAGEFHKITETAKGHMQALG